MRALTAEEIADKKRRHSEANLRWKRKNEEKMREYFRDYRAMHGRARRAKDASDEQENKKVHATTLDEWGK